MKTVGSEWSVEDEDHLRKNWGKRSAAILGGELGRTRNAIMGKATRLKLAPHKPTAAERIMVKKAHKPRVKLDDAPMATPEAPEAIVAPVKLHQLNRRTCRWPLGEFEAVAEFFCGALPRSTAPYCTKHCKIAYQPPRPR